MTKYSCWMRIEPITGGGDPVLQVGWAGIRADCLWYDLTNKPFCGG